MRRDEVLIRRWPHDGFPPEYFHLVDCSLPLTFETCGHAFEQDELMLVRLGILLCSCVHHQQTTRVSVCVIHTTSKC